MGDTLFLFYPNLTKKKTAEAARNISKESTVENIRSDCRELKRDGGFLSVRPGLQLSSPRTLELRPEVTSVATRTLFCGPRFAQALEWSFSLWLPVSPHRASYSIATSAARNWPISSRKLLPKAGYIIWKVVHYFKIHFFLRWISFLHVYLNMSSRTQRNWP